MAHKFETGVFGRNIPAWHRLGTVVEGTLSTAEAIKLAQLDWTVVKQPLYLPNGELVDSHMATVRESDGKVLGVVSKGYGVVQNIDSFTTLDKLVGEGNLKIDTAISLDGGRRICIVALWPDEYEIAGDKFYDYIFARNTHDGTGSFLIQPAKTRVVCANTEAVALGERVKRMCFRHTSNVKSHIRDATRIMETLEMRRKRTIEEAEKLLAVKCGQNRFEDMLNHILPFPEGEESGSRKWNNVQERRSLLHRAIRVEDLENFRNTGWGFLQAVVDYSSNAEPLRRTRNWEEKRLMKVVDGDPIVVEAKKYLLALAN